MTTIIISNDITLTASADLCAEWTATHFDILGTIAKHGDFDTFSDMFKDEYGFRPSRDMMAMYADRR